MVEQDLNMINPSVIEADAAEQILLYLSGRYKTDQFIRLFAIFKKEIFLFLSLFQGEVIKVPSMNYLEKVAGYCKIFRFLEKRNFTEEAYQECAKTYNKRIQHLRAIVAKVNREMAKISADGRSLEFVEQEHKNESK